MSPRGVSFMVHQGGRLFGGVYVPAAPEVASAHSRACPPAQVQLPATSFPSLHTQGGDEGEVGWRLVDLLPPPATTGSSSSSSAAASSATASSATAAAGSSAGRVDSLALQRRLAARGGGGGDSSWRGVSVSATPYMPGAWVGCGGAGGRVLN